MAVLLKKHSKRICFHFDQALQLSVIVEQIQGYCNGAEATWESQNKEKKPINCCQIDAVLDPISLTHCVMTSPLVYVGTVFSSCETKICWPPSYSRNVTKAKWFCRNWPLRWAPDKVIFSVASRQESLGHSNNDWKVGLCFRRHSLPVLPLKIPFAEWISWNRCFCRWQSRRWGNRGENQHWLPHSEVGYLRSTQRAIESGEKTSKQFGIGEEGSVDGLWVFEWCLGGFERSFDREMLSFQWMSIWKKWRPFGWRPMDSIIWRKSPRITAFSSIYSVTRTSFRGFLFKSDLSCPKMSLRQWIMAIFWSHRMRSMSRRLFLIRRFNCLIHKRTTHCGRWCSRIQTGIWRTIPKSIAIGSCKFPFFWWQPHSHWPKSILEQTFRMEMWKRAKLSFHTCNLSLQRAPDTTDTSSCSTNKRSVSIWMSTK